MGSSKSPVTFWVWALLSRLHHTRLLTSIVQYSCDRFDLLWPPCLSKQCPHWQWCRAGHPGQPVDNFGLVHNNHWKGKTTSRAHAASILQGTWHSARPGEFGSAQHLAKLSPLYSSYVHNLL